MNLEVNDRSDLEGFGVRAQHAEVQRGAARDPAPRAVPPRTQERRVGRRVPVDLAIGWRPLGENRRWWSRRGRPQAARITDLSVSGALIEAPPAPNPLPAGSLVDIDLDGAHGLVEVKGTDAGPDGNAVHRVLFVVLQPALQARVYDLIS